MTAFDVTGIEDSPRPPFVPCSRSCWLGDETRRGCFSFVNKSYIVLSKVICTAVDDGATGPSDSFGQQAQAPSTRTCPSPARRRLGRTWRSIETCTAFRGLDTPLRGSGLVAWASGGTQQHVHACSVPAVVGGLHGPARGVNSDVANSTGTWDGCARARVRTGRRVGAPW